MIQQKPIYIEIEITADMDSLWIYTQLPELHEQWDLRFSEIRYLPQPTPNDPQRFLYTTRLGFGLRIAGQGETTKTRHQENGERTSALKFWSHDPKSLIQRGSGYWKYIPQGKTLRFLTWYDYETRFGTAGKWLDVLVFRPLMGWATAWSFDRLRLWLEKGIPADVSLRLAMIHLIARFTLAFAWIYQGIFPKLLYPDSGEQQILQTMGWFNGREIYALALIGVAEILFGVLFLWFWRSRSLFLWNIAVLLLLAVGALVSQPGLFVAPFNPATLNGIMIAIGLVGYLAAKDLPTADACRRERPFQ